VRFSGGIFRHFSASALRLMDPEFDTSAEDSHGQPRSHGRLRRILTKCV
jgi:hypothetical protein